jgi:uncharacterized protein
MTPQETQLVNELFDRLAKLESAPRDAEAERLIAGGLQRAPHAVYALVQTALVQDEALKHANARIEELQAQASSTPATEQRSSSFLDNMRDAFTGHSPVRGSVPNVRPSAPANLAPNLQPQDYQSQNFQPQSAQPQPGYSPPPPIGYPGGPTLGSGHSFLGTAASAAAGMIGGSLLLDGIRSILGHHFGGYGASSFGGFADNWSSPWSNPIDPAAANSDLARDLGADQIGGQNDDAGNDRAADVDSVANTDVGTAEDDYNSDDGYDTGDGGFDAADSGSYDV